MEGERLEKAQVAPAVREVEGDSRTVSDLDLDLKGNALVGPLIGYIKALKSATREDMSDCLRLLKASPMY